MSFVTDIAKRAKLAFNKFSVSTDTKNAILEDIAKEVELSYTALLDANLEDIAMARTNGQSEGFIDRLRLTKERIYGIATSVRAVVALKDPVGNIDKEYDLPNKLHVKKVRSPLGVIGIIFEARPNVAIDAAVLCLKSGNGVVLRGSKDAANSVNQFVTIIKNVLKRFGVDDGLVGVITSSDRESTKEMLSLDNYIDVIIPRGGNGLKQFVLENATMPVIASAGGNCHVYVSKYAKKEMILPIIINAKVQRPSVCNALETVLVDRAAICYLSEILDALLAKNVKIYGTAEVGALNDKVNVCEEKEFYKEYEDMIIKIAVVDDIDGAIQHINHFGTHHSDAIITEDKTEQNKFSKEVDSSAVYINASTRFTDGFELGLGAEIGISTQKLHVRGPIGLEELTGTKYVVEGNGQVRP